MDKTSQFNKEISIILEKTKPQRRKCSQCNSNFDILKHDIQFFNKFKVPIPKMCPVCRKQIRLAFGNYTTFLKRSCDVPGHNEKVISAIPDNVKFPVFDLDYYWSDKYDWRNYGIDYDSNKSFITQFEDLFIKTPQPALNRNPININSDYTFYGSNLKNFYQKEIY